MLEIYSLGDESVSSEMLAERVENDGFVVFVSSQTSQRKMANDVMSLLDNDSLINFEVNSANWPMCICDYSIFPDSEREKLKTEIAKVDNASIGDL